MKARTALLAFALVLATALDSPILAEDLPLETLYKNMAAKNYYPALEGLKDAQADVKSNILDQLVVAFPDAAGKPIVVKLYWFKPSPEAVPKQKIAFIGPENLSIKAKQRFDITPDMVINTPLYETMQITSATIEAGNVTVTVLSEDRDIKKTVLEIDSSTWKFRKMEMDMGDAQGILEIRSKDLGGKWGVESTVFSTPLFRKIMRYEYPQVERFWLPSRISVDYQGLDGKQLQPTFVYDFSGWQVNKGIPEGAF